MTVTTQHFQAQQPFNVCCYRLASLGFCPKIVLTQTEPYCGCGTFWADLWKDSSYVWSLAECMGCCAVDTKLSLCDVLVCRAAAAIPDPGEIRQTYIASVRPFASCPSVILASWTAIAACLSCADINASISPARLGMLMITITMRSSSSFAVAAHSQAASAHCEPHGEQYQLATSRLLQQRTEFLISFKPAVSQGDAVVSRLLSITLTSMRGQTVTRYVH